jgi:hypothetical protein
MATKEAPAIGIDLGTTYRLKSDELRYLFFELFIAV